MNLWKEKKRFFVKNVSGELVRNQAKYLSQKLVTAYLYFPSMITYVKSVMNARYKLVIYRYY